MNSDALYWFYSATAQVFSGFIAILGIFAVYALEAIQRSIEGGREDLSPKAAYYGLVRKCAA